MDYLEYLEYFQSNRNIFVHIEIFLFKLEPLKYFCSHWNIWNISVQIGIFSSKLDYIFWIFWSKLECLEYFHRNWNIRNIFTRIEIFAQKRMFCHDAFFQQNATLQNPSSKIRHWKILSAKSCIVKSFQQNPTLWNPSSKILRWKILLAKSYIKKSFQHNPALWNPFSKILRWKILLAKSYIEKSFQQNPALWNPSSKILHWKMLAEKSLQKNPCSIILAGKSLHQFSPIWVTFPPLLLKWVFKLNPMGWFSNPIGRLL